MARRAKDISVYATTQLEVWGLSLNNLNPCPILQTGEHYLAAELSRLLAQYALQRVKLISLSTLFAIARFRFYNFYLDSILVLT